MPFWGILEGSGAQPQERQAHGPWLLEGPRCSCLLVGVLTGGIVPSPFSLWKEVLFASTVHPTAQVSGWRTIISNTLPSFLTKTEQHWGAYSTPPLCSLVSCIPRGDPAHDTHSPRAGPKWHSAAGHRHQRPHSAAPRPGPSHCKGKITEPSEGPGNGATAHLHYESPKHAMGLFMEKKAGPL